MTGSSSRRRGGDFERALVTALRAHGVPHAERAGGGHGQAHGDILGLPGIVLEAKSRARLDLAEWCDTTRTLAAGRHWAVIVKRRGAADPLRSYVLLDLEAYLALVTDPAHPSTPPEGVPGRGERRT